MLETICNKPETKSEVKQWKHFPEQKKIKGEIELSKVYGWFDLPRDGGGDKT